MPANLPPQYSKAEDQYRAATSPADRLEALRVMFRLLPKHKGTEKLQSDLKQKISRAKEEIEGGKPGAKKSGLESSRPAGRGGPGRPRGRPERGQERDPGRLDQRQARGRPLPLHDPGPLPRHDGLGGRPPATGRPPADHPRLPRTVAPRPRPLRGRRAPGGRPGRATTSPTPPSRSSSGWPRTTPSWSASCRSTSRTRRSITSRR